MNKLSKVAFIITIISAVFVTGCQSLDPEEDLASFFTSVELLEYEDIKSHLSEDMSDNLKADIKKSSDKTMNELGLNVDLESIRKADGYGDLERDIKLMMERLNYKIIDKEFNKDKTEVKFNIEVTYISAGNAIMSSAGEVFSKMVGQVFSGVELDKDKSSAMLVQVLNENLISQDIEQISNKATITMVRDGDKWLISKLGDNALNAIMLGLPNTMLELNEDIDSFVDNTVKRSSKEALIIEHNRLLKDIYNRTTINIRDNDKLDYNNLENDGFVEIKQDVAKITSKPIKIGSESLLNFATHGGNIGKDIIYFSLVDKDHFVVYSQTKVGLIQYDGENS